MTTASIFTLVGVAIVAIGFYGFATRADFLRRILAFNVIGSGIFLIYGALGARSGVAVDPVPQALVITGIVVALAMTALAITLAIRLSEENDPSKSGEDAKPTDAHGAD